MEQDITCDFTNVCLSASSPGQRMDNSLHIPETIFSKACLRGLIDSRSSLLSKIETGRTVRCHQHFPPSKYRSTNLVIHCSPFRVDDHVFPSSISPSLGLLDTLLSKFLDRPRSVDISSVGTSAEDSPD